MPSTVNVPARRVCAPANGPKPDKPEQSPEKRLPGKLLPEKLSPQIQPHHER